MFTYWKFPGAFNQVSVPSQVYDDNFSEVDLVLCICCQTTSSRVSDEP